MFTEDNAFTPAGEPHSPSDAHGRAALLLIESLIHGLCENSTLSTDEAVEIAERAADVQRDRVEAADGAAQMRQAHALLTAIALSLTADGKGEPPRFRLV